MAFVAQGKVQRNTSQKIQICAELVFLRPNSEYAYVNFFRTYILTSLIPALTRRAVGPARVFYMAAIRATQRFVMGAVGTGSSESCFLSCDLFRPSMIQMQRF